MTDVPGEYDGVPDGDTVLMTFGRAWECLADDDIEGALENATRALTQIDDPLPDHVIEAALALEREIVVRSGSDPGLNEYRAALQRTGGLRVSTRRATIGRPSLASWRLCDWGANLAVEPERGEEWKEALLQVAAENGRGQVLRYAAGLLYAGLHSRVSWWVRRAATPCVAYLCWMLRSQVRTWVPLLGLLLWGGLETAADTGPGAAVVFVILSGVGFFGLVEWLRKRWNVQVRRTDTRP
ncbi:hypothetical protein AB0L65_20960 [Nonomuraea sp. NPDC052116]|uniref:hypothetical protein n=1 Tax=Nonomuraea sp. NPDC052116 TaxID=3155665 RepID=UPI00342DED77